MSNQANPVRAPNGAHVNPDHFSAVQNRSYAWPRFPSSIGSLGSFSLSKCFHSVIDRIKTLFYSLLGYLGIRKQPKELVVFEDLTQSINTPYKFLKQLAPAEEILRNQNDSDINMVNTERKSILFLLCAKEGETLGLGNGATLVISHEFIKRFMEKIGINFSLVTNNNCNPLHAVRSAQTARALLEKQPALVHQRDNTGSIPLHYALTVEIADVLLQSNALNGGLSNPNNIRHYPFVTAVKSQNLPVAQFLAEQMLSKDSRMVETLFLEAIGQFQEEGMQQILQMALQHAKSEPYKAGFLPKELKAVGEASPAGKFLIANGIQMPKEAKPNSFSFWSGIL